MNFAYRAYNCLTTGLFLTLFPPFCLYSRITGRHSDSLRQRLGVYPEWLLREISGSPRIWIHAASVGEVGAAAAVVESLMAIIPDSALILSTTTPHGQMFAQEKFASKATCIYAPLDVISPTRKALSTIHPDILVCIETEIWPHWFIEAHRMGIKTALINGRISVRSIKGYLKIRPLMRETLKHIDAFSMISEADALRIKMIGAPRDRIAVNGNAKYDLLLRQVDASLKSTMGKCYNVNEDQPVFVAGSTRNSEEKIILDVYRKILQFIPETLLIIAPRHVSRAQSIAHLVNERGFSCQLRTELDKKGASRTAPVVIVDTIGELKATYSIASIVFCGGSLVPLGGQNVLEAAVWSKPVLYGPSMEDFLDAKALLDKTGGGIPVKNGHDLAEKAIYYLTHPGEAEKIGKSAKKAVLSNQGAAEKHAAVIQRLLNP